MSRVILFLLWPLMASATTGEWLEVSRAPKGAELTVLRWRYSVRSDVVTSASFEVALPRDRHGGWALVRVQATEGAQLKRDAAGNLTLAVDAGALGAGETRIVTVTAELVAVTPAAGKATVVTEASPLLDLESVRPLAATVRAAAQGQRVAVLWESLQILEPEGFRASPRRVKTTLALGRGDCTDLALAVVAVARATGLPARLVTGWSVDGAGLLGPDAYHDWAEVHDGTRWRVLDLHARRLDPAPATLVATHIDDVHADVLSAFRFRPNSAGLAVQMLDGGGTARGGLR